MQMYPCVSPLDTSINITVNRRALSNFRSSTLPIKIIYIYIYVDACSLVEEYRIRWYKSSGKISQTKCYAKATLLLNGLIFHVSIAIADNRAKIRREHRG